MDASHACVVACLQLAAVVFRRKLQTHRLLFLTGLCDLPMFVYFAAEGEYSRVRWFAVHKKWEETREVYVC